MNCPRVRTIELTFLSTTRHLICERRTNETSFFDILFRSIDVSESEFKKCIGAFALSFASARRALKWRVTHLLLVVKRPPMYVMRSCISACFNGIEGILHHEYVLRCCASPSLLRGRPQSNAERARDQLCIAMLPCPLGPIFLQSHCRPGVGRLLGIQREAGVGGAAAAAAAGI